MHVSIGYSENPDNFLAGQQASMEALSKGRQDKDCDLILMFATSRYDAFSLKNAVSSIVGENCPIVGGGVIGIISNDSFGYASHRVIVAAFWFEQSSYQLFCQDGLDENAQESGKQLGLKMAKTISPANPVMLFYDSIGTNNSESMDWIMATPFLKGLESGLGFCPNIMGAGLLSDYSPCGGTPQWTGKGLSRHNALAIAFDKVVVDKVLMHGCYPGTTYYTVTKADKHAILEINGYPALDFIQDIIGNNIDPESYPLILMFGVNQGNKWDDYNEKNYINRLCLGIDKKKKAILMFEPDLVEGTEFQIMFRSNDDDYMPAQIEKLFNNLQGRKPLLAFYVDCAGRAATYAGRHINELLVVQKALNNRVPLLGIYSVVELASIEGHPQSFDWCGIFCLLSI